MTGVSRKFRPRLSGQAEGGARCPHRAVGEHESSAGSIHGAARKAGYLPLFAIDRNHTLPRGSLDILRSVVRVGFHAGSGIPAANGDELKSESD